MKKYNIFSLILIVCGPVLIILTGMMANEGNFFENYSPGDPIYINNSEGSINSWANFKEQGLCTGSGTEEDPYVIEGITIDSEDSEEDYCISIEDSEIFFIIRNCTITGGSIQFENVKNCEVSNIKVFELRETILFLGVCENVIIKENDFSETISEDSVFQIYESQNVVIKKNDFSETISEGEVFEIIECENVVIKENNFSEALYDKEVFVIEECSQIEITENNFSEAICNEEIGIIEDCKNVEFKENDFSEVIYNDEIFEIDDCENVIIKENDFSEPSCPDDAFEIEDCTNVVIKGNNLSRIYTFGGIFVIEECSQIEITENYISALNQSFNEDVISIYSSRDIFISKNEIFDCNSSAISLSYSTDVIIEDNILEATSLGLGSVGIEITYNDFGTISDNSIQNFYYGIAFQYDVGNFNLLKNNIFECTQAIYISGAQHCTIEENEIYFNKVGIFSMDESYDITINNNALMENKISINSYDDERFFITNNLITSNSHAGVVMSEGAQYSDIENNFIKNNGIGIKLNDSCFENTIYGNTIMNNVIGLVLGEDQYDSCYNNFIYKNYFIINGVNAVDNIEEDYYINYWDKTSLGNYWSNYFGVDIAPEDGIGDTPYAIYGPAGSQDNFPLMYDIDPPDVFTLTSNADVVDPDGAFDLNWTASNNAAFYEIYSFSSNITSGYNNSLTFISMKTNLSHHIKDLNTGDYYYIVVAFNPYGFNITSECIKVSIGRVPLQFTLASNADYPQDDDGNFKLKWTNSIYGQDYRVYIYKSEYGGEPLIIYDGIEDLSLDILDLSSGVYYVEVLVNNSYGEANSNVIAIIVDIEKESIPEEEFPILGVSLIIGVVITIIVIVAGLVYVKTRKSKKTRNNLTLKN